MMPEMQHKGQFYFSDAVNTEMFVPEQDGEMSDSCHSSEICVVKISAEDVICFYQLYVIS